MSLVERCRRAEPTGAAQRGHAARRTGVRVVRSPHRHRAGGRHDRTRGAPIEGGSLLDRERTRTEWVG